MAVSAVVVMGVAGCGKSSVGREMAAATGWPLIEGDDFHSAENRALMAAGIPLTDAHRQSWLAALAAELTRYPHGAVLSCSALKRAYRDQLRAARAGLGFVYLDLTPDEALARVQSRGAGHFFPASLIASQFETLEPPMGEPAVLRLQARLPLATLQQAAMDWLRTAAR